MMLTKSISPKTKAELIRALQAATFRKVEVFEGERLNDLPTIDRLRRESATVIVLM
ncbi:hypothetical protein ACQR50_16940 [Sphingomonas sp. Xoc002]|uniref:hypothetical protein n=1 Tax=Sphingomonas sp. Xoc002 TaxID=2837624 RepID=UPI003D178B5C